MKKVCGVLLMAAAAIYTLWYMRLGIPYQNSGALSAIGLKHPVLFTFWGLLTYSALAFNIAAAYIMHTKSKIYIPFLAVSGVGMALTLTCDFDYGKRLEYYLHCTGSLVFSVSIGLVIFLLFILCRKKGVLFVIFAAVTAAVLLGALICLLIFKENALIETLPVFTAYILLAASNFSRRSAKAAPLPGAPVPEIKKR
ncbi:MAG: hypothetical protein LUH82_04635 [Clostridiales bacterium]|nr:hypothetical protein [Clostridiales bacterium]